MKIYVYRLNIYSNELVFCETNLKQLFYDGKHLVMEMDDDNYLSYDNNFNLINRTYIFLRKLSEREINMMVNYLRGKLDKLLKKGII